jgi:hypothetical protein
MSTDNLHENTSQPAAPPPGGALWEIPALHSLIRRFLQRRTRIEADPNRTDQGFSFGANETQSSGPETRHSR